MVTFNYRGADDLPYLCPLHQTVDQQMIVRPVLVFVHGLNPLNDKNRARNTWTNRSRKFWPRDYLPHDIPNADILLFAYNSNAAINVSASSIKEHGCTLFQELEDAYREELRNGAVKFIFVCHSLGGLIVKRALVSSASHGRAPSSIKRFMFGLAFFGTPHGGSEAVTRYSGFADMFRKLIGESNIKNQVLESLAANSYFIQDLTYRFRQQEYDYRYATFYETKSASVSSSHSFPHLGNLMVSITSASMGLPRGMETRRLVDEDHSRMCRPPSRRSNHYLRIKKALQILVAEALGYRDELEYMQAIRTLRPNFCPQQNYDYESDSSGSHNALLQDNHVPKSLRKTDKVVTSLVGAAVLCAAAAVYIGNKEKQAERSDYQADARQGHENSARRRLKRREEPRTRDHHSSRRVPFPQDPFSSAPHPYMSTRGDFPTIIYYVPMPHYTAPPPLYEGPRPDTRRSYRREG